MLTKPDPVPYTIGPSLVYICYNISSNKLVTYDWGGVTGTDDIVVFVIDPNKPTKSYGILPFLVDGIQPFADGTVSLSSLNGTPKAEIEDGTVTNAKLATAAVSSDKLAPDAIMSMPFDVAVSPYVWSVDVSEVLEDGTLHYAKTGDDSTYKGGGFSVVKATKYENLYVDIEYKAPYRMHVYVINPLIKITALEATGDEVKTARLVISKTTLDEKGHNTDTINIAFTYNMPYDMYIYSIHARYIETDYEYFGDDYNNLKSLVSANTTEVSELSETADNLLQRVNGITKPYAGKKILFMGDSITALGTSERGWLKYFNEIIEPASFVNTAVASARWCDYSDTVYDGNPVFNGADANHNNTMGNQIEKLLRGKDSTHENYNEVADYADFDMILIACGTNDGDMTAEIEPSFTSSNEAVPLDSIDRTIIPSAFRYVIENLQTMYPNALIFICTPIQGYITTRSYSSIKAKGDYLKLLAGRMSVEVIDTFECGVCDIYEKKGANGRYLIDGLHPNVEGAKIMGKYNAKAVISKYV